MGSRNAYAEPADLQIDDQQAFETAVEEEQIDAKPCVVQPQPALAADEGEVVAQLQQEVGQVLDEGIFQLGFGVLVLEVQELQHEGVFDSLLGGDGVAGLGQRGLAGS